MNPVETWRAEAIAETTVEALKKNGFDAVNAKTGSEALQIISKYYKKGAGIAFGGSMTVKDLGIQEKAVAAGCEILDHNVPGLSPEEKTKIMKRQLTSDIFICSTNAVSMEGELFNIDGTGNRVAALSFGPEKVIIVAGINKIVRDADEAFARMEMYASPMNNKRLNTQNPCIKSGVCIDCSGDTRICRIYHVLRKRPRLSDFTVIIVGESLGY
jgi:L-lactate utilization protein LutB